MSSNSTSRGAGSTLGVILVVILLVFGLFGCGAMTSESKAINAAEDAGYTDITVVDKAVLFIEWRGCSSEDQARFTVRGTNPAGKVREFYVCAGVLKGGTIRSK